MASCRTTGPVSITQSPGLCQRAFAECGRRTGFPYQPDVQESPKCTICPGRFIAQRFLPQAQHGGGNLFRARLGSAEMVFQFGFGTNTSLGNRAIVIRVIVKPDACAGPTVITQWMMVGRVTEISDKPNLAAVWR